MSDIQSDLWPGAIGAEYGMPSTCRFVIWMQIMMNASTMPYRPNMAAAAITEKRIKRSAAEKEYEGPVKEDIASERRR